jgi:hypothetical protein
MAKKPKASDDVIAVFTWNDRGKPPDYVELIGWRSSRKMGDVDLFFQSGALAGFTLTGFVVSVNRLNGAVRVSLPNRLLWNPEHDVNRSVAILRPTGSTWEGERRGGLFLENGHLKTLILAAYEKAKAERERNERQQVASCDDV